MLYIVPNNVLNVVVVSVVLFVSIFVEVDLEDPPAVMYAVNNKYVVFVLKLVVALVSVVLDVPVSVLLEVSRERISGSAGPAKYVIYVVTKVVEVENSLFVSNDVKTAVLYRVDVFVFLFVSRVVSDNLEVSKIVVLLVRVFNCVEVEKNVDLLVSVFLLVKIVVAYTVPKVVLYEVFVSVALVVRTFVEVFLVEPAFVI